MKVESCQIRHVDSAGFRSGQWGHLAGVFMVTPDPGKKPRPCYFVIWPDGIVDYCPMEGGYQYEFRSTKV